MKYLLIGFMVCACSGCTTINVTIQPGAGSVEAKISCDKNITTNPAVTASGNTVPLSVIP